MRISVGKQTPVMALAALVVIAAAAYTRFGVAPFDNEIYGARVLPLTGEYLSAACKAFPVWSIVVSAMLTVAAGIVVGRMGVRFNLYPAHTFLSMPVFGIIACGIFISADTLAASLTALLAAMALRFLFRGYLRERDLASMLYSGLCIGSMLLVSTAGTVYLLAAMSALFVLSFSSRELLVLMTGIVLPVAACCYGVWAFGGEFLLPVTRFVEALTADSGVRTFGDNAVAALALCGLVMYTFVFAMLEFSSSRFRVSVKSRGILVYCAMVSVVSLLLPLLPSSTPADFAVAAVPMSLIIPILFMQEGERMTGLLYMLLLAVYAVHLFSC